MIVVITTLVTRGMAALLQSSVEGIEWSSEVKVNYSSLKISAGHIIDNLESETHRIESFN